jgi:hypothetical protein
VLAGIETPTVVVPGNNETEKALLAAWAGLARRARPSRRRQRHRRGTVRLVTATAAAVIRQDDAEAGARQGIDQRRLAQFLHGVREPVVQDHRGAIATLVLKCRRAPSWPFAA